MSARVSATIVMYALGVAVAAVVAGALGRGAGRRLVACLVLLEIVLVAQALAAALGLAGGHEPADPATYAGYLAASVLLLPAAGGYAFAGRTRWDSFVLALACLAVAVVTLRLHETWPQAGA